MPVPLAALVPDGRRVAYAGAGHMATVDLDELPPGPVRWVWWQAASAAPALVAAGRHVDACWDLGAVHRLLHGGRREDPAAVRAGAHGWPEPPLPDDGLTLLARDGSERRQDLSPPDLARVALETQALQQGQLAARPDPRPAPTATPLALLGAQAESAAALLAVELEHHGLPLSVDVASALLTSLVGPRGTPAGHRDAEVRRHFSTPADLRNPLLVRAMLGREGFDVPDTRSWRLEAFAGHPGIAALLAWRKVERIATTYGWGWLDTHVRDGRLRGRWLASDGAGGRMTASAGLHNLPSELRACVAAEPGHAIVRADLGQVEPRVLAVVSGDVGLAAATHDEDLYAPVARALGVERATAKIAVLAAMYGQTSGTAGDALTRMERAYPQAIAYLRAAEDRGRAGQDVHTWGGRRVRMGGAGGDDRGRGRYARNAVVQGAAAELFKAWAATVRAGLPALDGRIVLCLHDELLVHVPADRTDEVEALLHSALAATAGWWASGCGVRFVAVTARGASWAEAKD